VNVGSRIGFKKACEEAVDLITDLQKALGKAPRIIVTL